MGVGQSKTATPVMPEVIAKTLFNLTRPTAPFDLDSPYWVIKNAIALADILNMPSEQVVEIVR